MAVLEESTPSTGSTAVYIINNVMEKADNAECLILNYGGLNQTDNHESVVSAEHVELVLKLNYAAFLPVLFLIGGPANVINMAVFYKQGLRERINVCLFSLSLSDFLYLLGNVIFYAEQMWLQFTNAFAYSERFGPHMRFMFNNNLLGFYGFTWVSQFISAIIASERCFCILQPLRSQTVLSTSTTIIIIVICVILIVGAYTIIATRYRAQCVHDTLTGSDSWILTSSQFYFDNQEFVDFLDGYLFGVAISVVTMTVLVVATVVTMVKLRQAAAWRAGTSTSSSVSAREMALTVMLVYNSIFFVICVFPLVLFRVAMLFMPEMNAGRKQHNMYVMFNWMTGIVTYVNATFNIVVYYTMGSRYRQTFWQLMGRASKAG